MIKKIIAIVLSIFLGALSYHVFTNYSINYDYFCGNRAEEYWSLHALYCEIDTENEVVYCYMRDPKNETCYMNAFTEGMAQMVLKEIDCDTLAEEHLNKMQRNQDQKI